MRTRTKTLIEFLILYIAVAGMVYYSHDKDWLIIDGAIFIVSLLLYLLQSRSYIGQVVEGGQQMVDHRKIDWPQLTLAIVFAGISIYAFGGTLPSDIFIILLFSVFYWRTAGGVGLFFSGRVYPKTKYQKPRYYENDAKDEQENQQ